MEMRYQIAREDYKRYYEVLWRDHKRRQRERYVAATLWYLVVLALGVFLAVRHDEIFATCAFVVLGTLYIAKNWSFARWWERRMDAAADVNGESVNRLIVDDSGLTESLPGVDLHVDWSQIHHYTLDGERLFLHFLKQRAFIIPLQQLSEAERSQFVGVIKEHGVPEEA